MSKKYLIIVESPAKSKTIKRFLGKQYQIKASKGHLIDLPKSKFGIDIKNNFAPHYITIRGKGEILKNLKDASKKADKVLLAADPDREGEAICWHLHNALKLDDNNSTRVQFNEITKNTVKQAIKNPRNLDENKVDAQQTRRILDRLVGYQISPLLWKKVKKGLSAGRVQSVAVRLICERENEIKNFNPEEYWTVDTIFTTDQEAYFKARVIKYQGNKIKLSSQKEAEKVEKQLNKCNYAVSNIKRTERERKPVTPFITSTLQQEASQHLGYPTGKTMRVAQQLYEGLKLGSSGEVGLVTYIRTDSIRISPEAAKDCQNYIKEAWGEDFLPASPPQYRSQKAQDAHEAIRPTSVDRTPEKIKGSLTRDQHRLYKLIWNRFVASQMAPALIEQIRVDIQGGDYLLRATGSQIKFPGFLLIYSDRSSSKSDMLPAISEDTPLKLQKVQPEQHFTQPPSRYHEASLVKTLEKKGIGRPSTYSPIIETIQARGYVLKENKVLVPTELGEIVVELMKDYFPEVIDVEFTARLEEKLDNVEEGKIKGIDVLNEFYASFENRLKVAEEQMKKVEIEDEVSDETCPHCSSNLVYKHGRYGRFLACPGFPDCRFTKNINASTGVECPLDGGELVLRRSKKGRTFYGCSNYPDCEYTTWQRPLQENCPECGHFMVEGKRKSQPPGCGNPECSYEAKDTAKSGRSG